MKRASLVYRLFFGRNAKRTLVRAAVLAVVLGIVVRFAFRPCMLDGISMEPTYRDRSFNVVNLLQYVNQPPQRGDVVCIEEPGSWRIFYLKRVLALPGETIEFRRGMLHINGQRREEPYLQELGTWNFRPMTLEPNEYFVAGDNRAVPFERHLAGGVRRSSIAGGIIF